jgi:hypothetical protein
LAGRDIPETDREPAVVLPLCLGAAFEDITGCTD